MKVSFLFLLCLITQKLALAGIEPDQTQSDILDVSNREAAATSQRADAPIQSSNSQIICDKVQKLVKPSTSAEVVDAITFARSNHLHVRTVGKLHTINTLICTDGVMISTENLNKIIGIENFNGDETVLVEPGVQMGELAEWLHERDRSLGYALINYRGVSVAGVVATGSRGDSPVHPVMLSSLVRSFKIVNAEGQIVEYTQADTPSDLFKALRTNLGLMGSVIQMRIKILPQFNIKVKNTFQSAKYLFKKDGIISAIRGCDYGQLRWFPHTGKFFKTCGNETKEKADPSATNTSLDPKTPKFFIKPIKSLFQAGAANKKINALIEHLRLAQLHICSPFSRTTKHNVRRIPKSRIVGFSHHMISSDLSPVLKEILTTEWEIAIPLSKADAALSAIRDLIKKNSTALPFSGITIRYAPVTEDTLIALPSANGDYRIGDPVIFFNMVIYEPKGFSPEAYSNYKQPYREIAETLVRDFNGRAHWAKNEESLFHLQKENNAFGGLLNTFKTLVEELDPSGVFSNDFSVKAGISIE